MKKLYILLIAASGYMLNSCDALNVEPISTITSDSFWKNAEDAEAYLTGIYSVVRSLNNTTLYGEDRGDALDVGDIGPSTEAWAQNLNSSNAPSFRSPYNIIHHTNLLLNKIEGLKFSDESKKNRIKAEAYFLRAQTYFFLVRIWGDVPLVLEPTLSDNVKLKGRSPKAEVMTQILSDIEMALSLFPNNEYRNKNFTSKGATYALKADALIWKAKVLGGNNSDLESAIAAISEIERTGVSLLGNYASIFSSTNKKNSEVIFSLFFDRYETNASRQMASGTTTSRTDNLSDRKSVV